MGPQVYDRFPTWARAAGFMICSLLGGTILLALPDDRLFSLLFFVPGIFMLLWQNVFILRFDGRSWTYRQGLWPIIKRRAGSFDDLNGMEVDTRLYNPTDRYGNSVDNDMGSNNTYTAYLRFKDPSMKSQPLITGRSFGEAAHPA